MKKTTKASYGPDWIDVFRLQHDLLNSQGVASNITVEATGTIGACELLCSISAVSCGADGVPRTGVGTAIEVEYRRLSELPRRVHEALSDLYTVLDAVPGK